MKEFPNYETTLVKNFYNFKYSKSLYDHHAIKFVKPLLRSAFTLPITPFPLTNATSWYFNSRTPSNSWKTTL